MKFIATLLALIGFGICFSQTSTNEKAQSSNLPKYIDTGNPDLDALNYSVAKEKWIKENPEEYRVLNNNTKASTTGNDSSIHKIENVLPFNPSKTYKLIKIEAIPANGMIVSNDELSKETESIKLSFPENLTLLEFDQNSNIRLYIEGKFDFRAVESKKNSSVGWYGKNKNCESCSKTLYLSIVEETAQLITYILLGEDEGTKFSYRFTFKITASN